DQNHPISRASYKPISQGVKREHFLLVFDPDYNAAVHLQLN
ncbi:unnamed protein product, partial [Microthlaspi erraticum]